MKLIEIAVPTIVVRSGMTLREVFHECVTRNVGGLPYVDDDGRIVGRISTRNIIKHSCIPDFLINAADFLGDHLKGVELPDIQFHDLLAQDARDHIFEPVATAGSEAPLVKGLAIMEHYNSSYLFVVDNGEYKGAVTRMAIARQMLLHAGVAEGEL